MTPFVPGTVVPPSPAPASNAPAVRQQSDERHLPFIDLLDRLAVFAATEPVRYQRIRAALPRLQPWFAEYAGWTIQVTPDYARLIKAPARAQAGHGWRGERAYTAREYAMMVWVLWYAEKAGAEQFVVTGLTQEIQEHANAMFKAKAEDATVSYIDWRVREHRAAFRVALQALEAQGFITHMDGDLSSYVDHDTGDALYEYTALASHIPVLMTDACWEGIVLDHNPRVIDELPEHDRTLGIRSWRTLLLTSGITKQDPDLLTYVRSQRARIAAELEKQFGWTLELGPTYAAVIRPTQDPRLKTVFPTARADMALPMLLANAIRADVAAGQLAPDPVTDAIVMSHERLQVMVSALWRDYREYWSAELRDLSAAGLTDRLLEILTTWGLVSDPDETGHYHIWPMLGRHAGVYRTDGIGIGREIDPEELALIDDPAPE